MDYVACQEGVYDCSYEELADAGVSECSAYNNHYLQLQGEVWVVVLATLVMGGMGLAIGGNDVANAWGTSVGSGAIKVQHALVVAAISNVMGAILLGSGVADKLQHGVTALDAPECFACGFCDSKMSLYSLGMLSALFAAAVFLFLATARKLPVSTTHAIVGGIVGITMSANRDVSSGVRGVLYGTRCVDWSLGGFGGMVASWVISPVLAGALGCLLYTATSRFIYNTNTTPSGSDDIAAVVSSSAATERTLRLLPACYAGMTWTMVYLISSKSTATKGLSPGMHLGVASALGVTVFLLVSFGLVPYISAQLRERHRQGRGGVGHANVMMTMTSRVLDESTHSDVSVMDRSFNPLVTSSIDGHTSDSSSIGRVATVEGLTASSNEKEKQLQQAGGGRERGEGMSDVSFCFQYVLLCVAALESFAHGANDTANSTAAFSAVVRVYEDGLNVCSADLHTPVWVMAVGGGFVGMGVLLFGRGVIETIGEKLTSVLDCHKGFCIEFASCAAVVCASVLGLPVSTTHCQVGAVVAIGMQSAGVGSVDWPVVREIIASWMLTVPFAALLAGGILNALKLLV